MRGYSSGENIGKAIVAVLLFSRNSHSAAINSAYIYTHLGVAIRTIYRMS
jgi:hypothetical protein